MRRYRRALFLFLLLTLSGCGGGGGSSSFTGRATFTVVWPASSRLIPAASNSIKVDIKNGTTVLATQVIPRPASGGPASVTFDPLPVASLTAAATAYPNTNGTGTAQATASVPLTIRAGQNTAFGLTMASTIDHLEVSPANPGVEVGAEIQLTAVAKAAVGQVVLTSPAKMQWLSNDTGIATVNTGGEVTGVAAGTADITVTEMESGKSLSFSIVVSSASGNVKYNPANGHYYEVVIVSSRITWLEAKAAAEARTYQGLRGHLVTQTSDAETNFLVANFDLGDHYLGAYQDITAPDYSEPGGGWRWVTGEPWSYTNWITLTNEPNDVDTGRENYTHYKQYVQPGAWNDIAEDHPVDGGKGYVVEYE